MMSAHYPTDKGVAARVEELLREQLLELFSELKKLFAEKLFHAGGDAFVGRVMG